MTVGNCENYRRSAARCGQPVNRVLIRQAIAFMRSATDTLSNNLPLHLHR